MAVFQIPVNNKSGNYQFRTTLSDIPLQFQFRYNYRATKWHMAIKDDEGTFLVRNIPVEMNIDLVRQFPHIGLPTGEILCMSATTERLQPTRENFGKDVLLFFNDLEE